MLEKKVKYHDQKKMVFKLFSCVSGLCTGSLVQVNNKKHPICLKVHSFMAIYHSIISSCQTLKAYKKSRQGCRSNFDHFHNKTVYKNLFIIKKRSTLLPFFFQNFWPPDPPPKKNYKFFISKIFFIVFIITYVILEWPLTVFNITSAMGGGRKKYIKNINSQYFTY